MKDIDEGNRPVVGNEFRTNLNIREKWAGRSLSTRYRREISPVDLMTAADVIGNR